MQDGQEDIAGVRISHDPQWRFLGMEGEFVFYRGSGGDVLAVDLAVSTRSNRTAGS